MASIDRSARSFVLICVVVVAMSFTPLTCSRDVEPPKPDFAPE